MYKKSVWLNKENSASTGNVTAFDGEVRSWKGDTERSTFLSVSDCHVSARLHKTDDDSMGDFIDKMVLLRNEIDSFVLHLKQNL